MAVVGGVNERLGSGTGVGSPRPLADACEARRVERRVVAGVCAEGALELMTDGAVPGAVDDAGDGDCANVPEVAACDAGTEFCAALFPVEEAPATGVAALLAVIADVMVVNTASLLELEAAIFDATGEVEPGDEGERAAAIDVGVTGAATAGKEEEAGASATSEVGAGAAEAGDEPAGATVAIPVEGAADAGAAGAAADVTIDGCAKAAEVAIEVPTGVTRLEVSIAAPAEEDSGAFAIGVEVTGAMPATEDGKSVLEGASGDGAATAADEAFSEGVTITI